MHCPVCRRGELFRLLFERAKKLGELREVCGSGWGKESRKSFWTDRQRVV
jgi:hypothetical protein